MAWGSWRCLPAKPHDCCFTLLLSYIVLRSWTVLLSANTCARDNLLLLLLLLLLLFELNYIVYLLDNFFFMGIFIRLLNQSIQGTLFTSKAITLHH